MKPRYHSKHTDGTGIVLSDHFKEGDSYQMKRPEGIKDWILTYTLSGEGYMAVGGAEYRIGPGDIAMIKGGSPHQYGTRKGHVWNFVWAHFMPGEQRFQWEKLPETDKGLVLMPIAGSPLQKRIYRAFKRVIRDSRQEDAYANELCNNALNEVLLLLSQSQSKPVDPRVAEVMHLMTAKMSEPLQIEDMAGAVGLSASRLSHLFKEETGRSVVDMLIHMRLRQAALLLEHSARTASEIAQDVGFRNYNHFTNQFKAHYGSTPVSFRNGKKPNL